MKLLLALAFMAVVCAIPHRGHILASNEEQWERFQGSGQGNNQARNSNGASLSEQEENSDESYEVEYEDDDDDSKKKITLEDLISTFNNIRDVLKKKIRDKLNHKDDKSIRVPFERVPANEEPNPNENTYAAEIPQSNGADGEGGSLNQSKRTQTNSADSNNTTGNDTASNHSSRINITQIKQNIHDNIENFILNILQPWLGNNSANGTASGFPQPYKITEPLQNHTTASDGGIGITLNGNNTVALQPGNGKVTNAPKTDAPQQENSTVAIISQSENGPISEQSQQPENDTVTDIPQPENSSYYWSQSLEDGAVLNETEGGSVSYNTSSDIVILDNETNTVLENSGSEISISSAVSQGIQENKITTEEVSVVN